MAYPARRFRRLLWSIIALVAFLSISSCAIFVAIEADEVAHCKWMQWRAGGKLPAEMDIASNISFRREGGGIVADFRKLEKTWSRICLTTFYAPGSPYLTRHDAPPTGVGIFNWRTMGCWAGVDSTQLSMSLVNRRTIELEIYRIELPADMRDRNSDRVVDTDYRYLDPVVVDQRQCSDTSDAVASCLESGFASSDHCLLVFRR
jgi:hypothetical protein